VFPSDTQGCSTWTASGIKRQRLNEMFSYGQLLQRGLVLFSLGTRKVYLPWLFMQDFQSMGILYVMGINMYGFVLTFQCTPLALIFCFSVTSKTSIFEERVIYVKKQYDTFPYNIVLIAIHYGFWSILWHVENGSHYCQLLLFPFSCLLLALSRISLS